MCSAKKPKVTAMPDPPPPQTVVTEDQAALTARGLERRRAGMRSGRQSTILAGGSPMGGMAPTTQVKTVLGA
jgi:hypothetical protein